MNIYLVKRTDDIDDYEWNEYRGFVCIADSEEEAISFLPGGEEHYWVPKEQREATCLGVADDIHEKGIIITDNIGA